MGIKTSKCCKCNKEGRIGVELFLDDNADLYCESCNKSLFKRTEISISGRSSEKKCPYPKEIKEKLDEYVVGQDTAKKILSVAAYNHYKRLEMGDTSIQKSNIMLIGPTGCGKTHLIRNLSKILDVPMLIFPVTNLTEAGFKGEDVTNILVQLYKKCDSNIEKTERAIVFLDEIDKLCKGSNQAKEQVGGSGVQQQLLTLIEGSDVVIEPNGSAFPPVTINTSNILFIVGGAFPNLKQIIANRLHISPETENITENVINKDLVDFGMIPEFIGRIPVTATLSELSVDTLLKILTEPKDAIVTQFQKLFSFDNISLSFEKDALFEIAKRAHDEHTGARGLRTIIENVLIEAQYSLPGSNTREYIVTKESVWKK